MLPFFNTSGPCIPGEHYMLPPQRRLHDALALIEGRRYFTLHAGRQTGKTTSATWLEQHLNATGRWFAAWVDLETPDVAEAMTAVLAAFERKLAIRHPQHLMLMAFLQRIVNGGGTIVREYGLGRGALDLLVEWRGQRHAIEVKLRRGPTTEGRALEQVVRYLDRLGLSEGWLVIFDLRKEPTCDEKITQREVEHRGKRVHVVGC